MQGGRAVRSYPVDAVLAVNYRCNSRCKMCNIWQSQTDDELLPEEFATLPPSLRTINVSGGEPFLRDDLVDVLRVLRASCPSARITISTNGFLPEKIERVMREARAIDPFIAFGVSIDGVGEKHDEVRGVSGGFERAIDTLHRVKAIGVRDLRIAFTASALNVEQFSQVYALAQRLGVQFTCAIAHSSSHYFRTTSSYALDTELLAKEMGRIVSSELKTFSPKRWARAYFTSGLFSYATGKGRPLPCDAGSAFFFLSPSGNVYPCNVLDRVMGNIRHTKSFERLWTSLEAELARETVRKCSLGCWMICTARTAMQRNIPSVAWWIATRKALAHAGFSVLGR